MKDNFGILTEKNNELELYCEMKSIIAHKLNFESPEHLRDFVFANFYKDSISKQFDTIYNTVLKREFNINMLIFIE